MDSEVLVLCAGMSSVRVCPVFGCNLFSWTVGGRELLYRPPGFGEDAATFYGGGIPILFPSVGRTWDRSVTPAVAGRYRWDGVGPYEMDLHGIGRYGDWQVEERVEAPGEARLVCRFSYGAAVRERMYPFDVELVQRFRLREGSLELEACLRNAGDRAAPYAFGYHPYFPVRGGRVQLDLPVTREVILDPELMIPTGGMRPAAGRSVLREAQGRDAVYGGIEGATARVRYPEQGGELVLSLDDRTANLVVYSSAGEPFVCVEPWTAGLGRFSAVGAWSGPDGESGPVLEPGETDRFRFGLEWSECLTFMDGL